MHNNKRHSVAKKFEQSVTVNEFLYSQEPMHPGIVLKTVYTERLNISSQDLADRTGIPKNDVDKLLNGELRVTSQISKQLFRVIGNFSDALLKIQQDFDFFRMRGHRIDVPADTAAEESVSEDYHIQPEPPELA